MAPALSANDRKWQRQDDARSLARAQEIMEDKTRHNSAVREAKIMAKDDEKRARAMKKVAAKRVAAKPTKRRITKSTKNKRKKR